MNDKIRNSILQAALAAVANLRSTADRLEGAAFNEDFDALAEISLSAHGWPLDQIRGAAMVIARTTNHKGNENARRAVKAGGGDRHFDE